jgi:tripartite-type tricarboxylate transporter receptor subunit TctC
MTGLSTKIWTLFSAGTVASMLMTGSAMAEFPERKITLVVPWPAGTTADIAARVLGKMASADLGQKIIVQNIPGGSGTVGTLHVKNAPADGYTLLNNWVAPHVVVPLFNPKVGYAIDDFEPIVGTLRLPFTITVAASHPANSLTEFAVWAKAQKRQINISTCSALSVPRMVVEETLRKAKITNYNPVAYEGCMPDAMKDLLAGTLDAATGVIAATKVFGTKVKHLAVMSDNREALAPDVLSAKEQGIDIGWGISGQGWAGLVVAKGTPQDRIGKLVAAFDKWAKSEEYRNRLAKLKLSSNYMPPESFKALWYKSMVKLTPSVNRLLMAKKN